MDIGKVMATTTEVMVEFGGEQVRVRYFPNKFTPRMQADLRKQQNGNDNPIGAIAPFVAGIVGDWDVTNGGKKVPPTVDNCMDMPATFLDKVIRTIAEDMSPNPAAAAPSDEGSFTAAEQGIPEWYRLVRAARYLRVAPWDLADQPTAWQNMALTRRTGRGGSRRRGEQAAG